MPAKTLYEILGIEPTADDKAIKKAYRRLAHKFHPDRNNGSADCAAAFRTVNAAYEVLADPKRRALYDQQLQQQKEAQQAPPKQDGFRVSLGEAGAILERSGNDLIEVGLRSGRDRLEKLISKKVPVGPRGKKILDEMAKIGSEAGRETLANLLKKVR